MHLEILGTRGEIEESAPRHRCHSGVLVDGRLLLDLGEPQYLDLRPELVAITHLHPDHAFFVTQDGSTEIPLYAPEAYHDHVQVKVLPEQLSWGGYIIRPVPTHHSKKVRSVALVVEHGSSKISYTGDLIWINKEYHPLMEGSELVITDGSYIKKGGMVRKDLGTGLLYGHNGIPDLIHLFSGLTERLLFVHFGSWFFRDIPEARRKLAALGRENGVQVQVGYDGMKINL